MVRFCFRCYKKQKICFYLLSVYNIFRSYSRFKDPNSETCCSNVNLIRLVYVAFSHVPVKIALKGCISRSSQWSDWHPLSHRAAIHHPPTAAGLRDANVGQDSVKGKRLAFYGTVKAFARNRLGGKKKKMVK